MRKYEFTGETKKLFERTLRQIRAIRSFGNVEQGDLGGWIEEEKNLSHDGDAWVSGDALVYNNAQVYGDAWVSGDALVYNNAQVSGDALVYNNARVYGNAQVSGSARVSGDALVCNNAQVYGDARVYGDAWVYGNARVYGDAQVYGNARVSGDARVFSKKSIMTISYIGSRHDTTTFFSLKTKNVGVNCGCFYDTIDEFSRKVQATHGDNEHGKAYTLAIELAKLRLDTNVPDEDT